jgi:hypothetical protein
LLTAPRKAALSSRLENPPDGAKGSPAYHFYLLSPLDDGTGFRLPRANGSDSPLAGTTSP